MRLQYPNATSIGFGKKQSNGVETGEFAIIVGVKEKKDISLVPANEVIPVEVVVNNESLKTDIIEVYENFVLGTCSSTCGKTSFGSNNAANRATVRPIQGGTSMSSRNNNTTVGTLGGIVRHTDSGCTVGLTNNHVIIDDAFFTSDRDINGALENDYDPVNRVYQNGEQGPGTPTDLNFGVSLRYVPIHPISTGNVNQVDAAIFSIEESEFAIGQSWNQVGLESILGSDAPPFASTSELDNLLATNPRLYSSGRTTGAKGFVPDCPMTVHQTGVTISLYYQLQGFGALCQFNRAIAFIKPTQEEPNAQNPSEVCPNPIFSGDSGSFLLADINGTIKIVGLCYAGSMNSSGQATKGYACRIDDIADQLGIEQYVDTATDAGVMVDPTTIEYITIPGQSDEKFILCENEEYWQVGFTGSLEFNCGGNTTTTTTTPPEPPDLDIETDSEEYDGDDVLGQVDCDTDKDCNNLNY